MVCLRLIPEPKAVSNIQDSAAQVSNNFFSN